MAHLLDPLEPTVSVRRYSSRERNSPHRDGVARLSILLSGSFAEDAHDGSIVARPGDILIKGKTLLHENRFGPDGALIASIALNGDLAATEIGDNDWRLRNDRSGLVDGYEILEAARANCRHSLVVALTSAFYAGVEEKIRRLSPPKWLAHFRQELEQTPLASIDVAARARAAGCHPAHASRLFRQCFGVSITEFARSASVRRAMALLHENQLTLSEAAIAAGFFDQSHMSRCFRRETGRTPGHYRRLAGWAALRSYKTAGA